MNYNKFSSKPQKQEMEITKDEEKKARGLRSGVGPFDDARPNNIEQKTSGTSLPNTSTTKEPILATVIGDARVNIRRSATKESPVLCVINPGDKLLVKSMSDKWAHISTSISGEDVVDGFVMREFIKED
jgi:hypothetical protein